MRAHSLGSGISAQALSASNDADNASSADGIQTLLYLSYAYHNERGQAVDDSIQFYQIRGYLLEI